MSKENFYIKTFGCKVNQYESQVMRERLLMAGYREAPSLAEAGLVIINTCTVTRTSDRKCFRAIRSAEKRGKRVVVAGCLIEDRLLDISRLKGAEYIVSNHHKHMIADILNGEERKSNEYGIRGLKGHTRAFVKVQDGCNNVCSYCKVRLVRGISRSRNPQGVYEECLNLIQNGIKEIVLTGICLGAYGKDLKEGCNLASLIGRIASIPGKWRMRISSIEPGDITDELISLIKSQEKVCRHIHIPLQSGDDYVLKKMRRPYSRSEYLGIIEKIKKSASDIAISTDIMVGFPGETDKMFLNTIRLLEEVRPMRVHVFPYSPRKGTEAFNYKEGIPYKIKKAREKHVSVTAHKLLMEFIAGFEGKECEVLVEDKDNNEGEKQGYTDRYIRVYISAPEAIKGSFIKCRLALTNSKVYGILPSYQI